MAITPISADLLLSWAMVKSGAAASSAASGGGNAAGAVKAPWEDVGNLTPASQLVSNALSGRAFFDASAKSFAMPGAAGDDKKLFALHAGLNQLAALAGRFDQKGVSTAEQQRLTAAFNSGLRQLDSFLTATKFDALSIVRGAKVSEAKSQAAVPQTQRDYVTGVIARGSRETANAAFAGDIRFSIDVTDVHDNAQTLNVDLADLGNNARSLDNVLAYLNGKLRGAGLTSGFTAVKQPAVNGQDGWSLKLTTVAGEKVSFTAADAAPSLYLAGDGMLSKVADPAGGMTTPAANAANVAFSKALTGAGALGAVRASAVGADGSIYVLADATGAVNGQPIKGASDVALFKYDTAGNLEYTRTLGAADAASGYALAVSADGRVAVAGALSGGFAQSNTTSGVTTTSVGSAATGRDSFVALYDADGVEQWVRRSDGAADEEARSVAFGADGELYVGSRAKDAAGLWQGALSVYDDAGVQTSNQALGAQDAAANQAIVVQDIGGGASRVTIGAVETGRLVLRQFSSDGAALAAGATRDLGALAGGSLAGLALDGSDIYVAGAAKAPLAVSNVARAYSGGQDGFVLKLADDLTAGASDRATYIGGAGDEAVAGFAVKNGEVWLGGDSSAAFAGQSALKDRDGFVGRLDAGGALAWSQRFAGPDKDYAASAFAFDDGGMSALDRLGLPQGAPLQKGASDLVSATALRAGDEFYVAVNGRTPQKITIQADDTLQKLADRVERVLLSAGASAVALSMTDGDKLKITASPGARIELRAGAAGKDALAGLGLAEGVVIADPTSDAAKKKATPIYGLGLSSTLSLADKASRKEAVDQLGAALSAVQKAFADLSKPQTAATPAGDVPQYMKDQLSNYQAALARLQSMTSSDSLF